MVLLDLTVLSHTPSAAMQLDGRDYGTLTRPMQLKMFSSCSQGNSMPAALGASIA
jgi:hypothetical protein